MTEIPLFPLKTVLLPGNKLALKIFETRYVAVLLPGNKLALKIFETRYVDMVANCMREDQCFGVILIQNGEETQSDSEIFSIGTTATIDDFQNRADGLLSITALGQQRFEIHSTRCEDDGLIIAEAELLQEASYHEVPEQFFYMQELLEHISAQEGKIKIEVGDFSEIMYQLIYQLPLNTLLKQRLLEVPDCNERAVILHAELIRLGVIQYVKPDQ